MVPALEREYQAELAHEKVRLTRIVVLLAVPLNVAFLVLDLWAVPSALGAVWALRMVIFGTLLVLFVATWMRSFPRWYAALIATSILIVGQAINAMILLANPDELAAQVYYGGLILVILALHTMTHLEVRLAAAISVVFALTYLGIALAHGRARGAGIPVQVVAHLFFFAGTAVIGGVAQSLRDRYSRENYVLRHSLQRDVEIKHEEGRRAAFLAEHDPLTGLANRMRLEREVGERIRQSATRDGGLALMFIDLDDFKPVNDTHGHAAGDRVLRMMAERLRRCMGSGDLVARLGGDEFVVVVGSSARDQLTRSAGRVAAAIEEPVELRGAVLRLTASIGVSRFPEDGADLDQLLRAADEQIYRVKRSGKGGVSFTTSLSATAGPR